MIHDHRLAMIVALVCAILISTILAQTMTYRLRKLTRAAMQYARGNAPMDVEIKGRDEIGDLARSIHYMAEEIEQRNLYNRDFMSTAAHELKTPVTAIKGAAEVLEQGAAEKEDTRKKFLSNIRFEADRLNRMVSELSELTRLDAEMIRGQKEKMDYCQCIKEILERLMPTFDREHAAFTMSVPDENIPVLIVPGRIEQVIANLLENAFRYTPVSGTVELSVTRQDDNTVLTSIRDSGTGIPTGDEEKIFKRFYTTEPKDEPKDYGSGLGLAIAKSIIENHQGGIRAESEQGKGAVFSFTLSISD
jgi:signal transduction histidine kinase